MKYKVIILFLFAMFSYLGYAQDASGCPAATGSSLNAVLAAVAVTVILVLSYLVVKYKKKATTTSLPSKEEETVTTKLPEEKPVEVIPDSGEEPANVVEPDSGEIYAVIAMALTEALYEDHDDENMVLTMKDVSRSYSPWSSKIYTLREIPKR